MRRLSLLLLLSCAQKDFPLEESPCDDKGSCLSGYACDTFRNVCISLLEPVAPYVTDLRASAGDKQVTLDFTLPNAFFHECQIVRKDTDFPTGHDDAGAFKISASFTVAGQGSVVDRNLANGTTYAYVAMCRVGDAWSDEARTMQGAINAVKATPLDVAPANPTDFTASDGEVGKSTLRFTMTTGVTECQVRRDTAAVPASHTAGTLAGNALFGAGMKAVVDTGLTAGTTYYYAVFCRLGTTWNDTPSATDTAIPN